MLTLALFVVAASACQQPLFPEDLPRTQFERYQTLRGEYRRSQEENAFGADQPPLRERLAPLE